MAVIKVLNVNGFAKGLTPVTSTEIKTRTGEYSPRGLFSEDIFGPEDTKERGTTYSFINLNTKVIHPTLYKNIMRLERKLQSMFSTEKSFIVKSDGSLVESEEGGSGIVYFIEIFPKIKWRGGTSARESLIKLLKECYKNNTLFISKIPVLPPDLRPYFEDESGQPQMDELNNVYLNILRKSFQMKGAGTSGPFYDLLNWGMQTAVNDHDKFIKKKVEKKSGLIRNKLLGKRVDFDARVVITPGPNLDINQIGTPFRIAVQIFQPFLIHYLLFSKNYPYKEELEREVKKFTEVDLSVDSLKSVLKSITVKDKVPEKLYKLIYDATEIVMKGRVVIAKRDPALHDGSMRGFYPVLIEGDTLQMCTLQVGSFNADFDGDQMAIYHPLSIESQNEIKEKMMRAEGTKNTKSVMFEISKEMCVGLYMITKNIPLKKSPIAISLEDMEKATDPYIPVIYKKERTTMGKAIFNSVFPPDFPFIDDTMNKGKLNSLIPVIVEKYGDEVSRKVFSKLEKIGFKFATIMAPSFDLSMMNMPASIGRIKNKLKDASPDEGFRLLDEGEEIMKEALKSTTLYDLVDSGSSKGWNQPKQMFVAKGMIADPKGKLLDPVPQSFSDGLSTTEFFKASSGSRKGMVDRALNTSTTGYFTRQLVYLLNSVEASPTLKDCGVKKTIELRLDKKLMSRINGRYIVYGNKVVKFEPENFKPGQAVSLRTPVYCRSDKICHTCYGDLIKKIKTPYVGILAGSNIGERGTQLIMRTFHTGGAATVAKHDILQEILDNDPLVDLEK